MARRILAGSEQYVKQNHRRRAWQKIVSVLGCIVVFCTTYALILPAITMENKTSCGIEEHEHSESCYVQVTEPVEAVLSCSPESLGIHVHTEEDCYDDAGVLTCEKLDYVAHIHGSSCYDAEGDLVCVFPEIEPHQHDDACYAPAETVPAETVPAETAPAETTPEIGSHVHSDECYAGEQGEQICGLEETEGHTHDDSCKTVGTDPVCGLDETEGHTHGEGCTDEAGTLVCELAEQEAHTHDTACYEQTVTCGLEEKEAHLHDEACYAAPAPTCGQEETAAAETEPVAETEPAAEIEAEPELICTTPEVEAHVHSDGCFHMVTEQTLTCTKEENEEHTHSALCYGVWELVCETEEHIHELQCFSDPEADVETAKVWERTFENAELTGVWAEDVLAIAKTQLGYAESERNYIVTEKDGAEIVKGYTRFGEWYGDPYGHWCAMYASFAIRYAGIPEEAMPIHSNCQAWIELLDVDEEENVNEEEEATEPVEETEQPELTVDRFFTPDEYLPKAGDLIFFDWEGDGESDHVGIVAEVITESPEAAEGETTDGTAEDVQVPVKVKVIEGNSGDCVQYQFYRLDNQVIMGYGSLPENPNHVPPVQTYTYSDEEIYVEVRLPEDNDIPAGAVLKVTPIVSGHEKYDTYVAQAEASVEGTVSNILLYDIGFYTADDEHIPVGDTAGVSIAFTESPLNADAQLQVVHFAGEDETPVVIGDVTFQEKEIDMVLEDPAAATEPEEPQITETLGLDMLSSVFSMGSDSAAEPAADAEPGAEADDGTEPAGEAETVTEVRNVIEFTTDGFSTFAVVEVDRFVTTEIYDTANDVTTNRTDLDGKTLIITMGFQAGGRYSLSSEDVKIHEWYDLNGAEDYYEHDRLKGITAERIDHTITNPTADRSLLWKFQAAGDGTYYVQSVSTDRYLLIDANRTAKTTVGYTDANKITVLPDKGTANRVELMGNGNYLYSGNAATQEQIHSFGSWGVQDSNTKFILSEYTGDSERPNDSVTVPVTSTAVESLAGKVYVMAGVNFDTENSADDAVIVRSTAPDNNGKLTGGNAPDDLTLDADGNATALKIDGDNNIGNSLWVFEPAANGQYYVRSLSTGQYLRTNSYGNIAFNNAGDDDIHTYVVADAQYAEGSTAGVKNAMVLYHTINGNDFYVALDNNNINGNFYSKDTNAADLAAHLVLIEQGYSLVTNLGGKSYIISAVNNSTSGQNNVNDIAVLSAATGTNANTLTAAKPAGFVQDGTAITSVSVDSTANVAWTFEAVAGKPGKYHIKDATSGKYLHIGAGQATLRDTAQEIEVREAVLNAGNRPIQTNVVSLLSEGGWLILYMNNVNNYFSSTKAGEIDEYTGNRGTHLVLTEVTPDAKPSEYIPVTGLGDKVFFVVGVDNADDNTNNALPALSSTAADGNGLTGQNITDDIIGNGYVDADIDANNHIDDGNDLGWAFKETNTPGMYNIMVVNGANGVDLDNHLIAEEETTYKYLNINADGTLTVSDTKQDIEVVKASAGGSGVDAVALRTEINGVYHYVVLQSNDVDNNFFSSNNLNESNNETHLALVEMKSVNNVVDMINELLFGDGDYYTESDNMEFVAYEGYSYTENGVTYTFDGSFKFGDDAGDIALTGTATNDNGDQNQGDGNDPNYGNFKTNYDNAVAYREKQQELAKAAKAAYDALPEEEKKYVYNAEELLALKWLWTELETVAPAAPNATVKLFNYSDGTVAGQPDVNNYALSNNYGFNFYHKNQYNAYTAENVQTRNNSSDFGNNDTGLVFAPTLNANDMPEVVSGWDSETGKMQDVADDDDGSLGYLFSETESPYHVATMEEGGGLFRYDETTGYYFYHANQNAAQYVGERTWIDGKYYENEFVLYDAVVRPMYVPAVGANNNEDRYNFLPFDDPTNTAIVDPNTMDVSWTAANDQLMTWKKTSAYLNERPDMWFGMTINTTFFMPTNGQVRNPQGQLQDMVFKFHGDDDTLIYINGVLVVDIGGVHGAEDGWINFATGEVFYEDSNGSNGTKGEVKKNILQLMIDNFKATEEYKNATDAEILEALKTKHGIEFETTAASNITLKQYTTYDLDFFYMERGGNVSYCGIEYNLVTIPENSLTIRKEVDMDTNDDGIDDVIDTNLTYTYRVLQVDGDDNPDNDKNYFTVNTPYLIYDSSNRLVGTGYVDANGYITLKEGQRAEFSNITDPYKGQTTIPDYVVQEILPNGEKSQYKVYYTCIGTDKTLIENEDTGLIEGEHTFFQTAPIRISESESQVVIFTNAVQEPTGSLAIQKALSEGTSELSFTFKIETGGLSSARALAGETTAEYSKIEKGTRYKLYNVNADGTLGKLIQRTVTAADGTTTTYDYWEVDNDNGTITLQANQRAVFDGILAGTYFKITEVDSGQYAPTYVGEILNKDTIDVKTIVYDDASGVYGTFTQDDADVLAKVTNDVSLTKVELPIKKTVSNWYGADSFEFDTKRITTVDLTSGIPSFSDDDLEDVANPMVSINGVTGTVTSGGQGALVFNYKQDDVQGANGTKTLTFYYRVTEKVDNNKSFIYDKSIYVVEVTLTQNDDKTWSGKVTRVWEDSDGSGDLPYKLLDADANTEGAQAPASLDFENYRYTRVLVRKYVSGVVTNDSFDFKVTVHADFVGGEDGYEEGEKLPFDLRLNPPNTAAGSGLHISEEAPHTATFSLNHGGVQVIYVPYGATVIVEETSKEGYITTHNVDKGSLQGGAVTDEFEADGEIVVDFYNEKTTSVTISKEFEQGSNTEFNFTATITSPAGVTRTENFTLIHGQEKVIDGIQFGSTIVVEETDGAGYITTYRTTTKIEAESGSATGTIGYQKVGTASGGIQLGNIQGSSSTVTLRPQFKTAGAYKMSLQYDTGETRSFVVDVNGTSGTYECTTDHGWDTGLFMTYNIPGDVPIVSDFNTITIGGTVTTNEAGDTVQNYAPNLDYIVLTSPEVDITPTHTVTEYVNGEMTIHFTNKTGYELPMTGGTGTNSLYTMGGMLLMAAGALLLYIHNKRRKEDPASS